MAGIEVSRAALDMRSAEAVLTLRDAARKIRTVKFALDNLPTPADSPDPLTAEPFNYTPDEAYLLRVLFEQLTALEIQPILDTGRKLTGLE